MTSLSPSDVGLSLGAGMGRLKLRHLQLLDQILQRGSLSAAALALGVSQPGATKMLRELESAFGQPLMDRSPRGGRLTPAGGVALERIRIALGSLATARQAIGQVQDQPLVRLGMLPLVGIEALGEVVAELASREQLPRLALRTGTVEGLLELLARGEVDAVVGGLDGEWMPESMRQFQVRPLWKLSLVPVAAKGHPLARRKAVTWAQTLAHDWALMPLGSTSRRAIERAFVAAGLAPPPARIETESFHIALSLAARSRMLTVVPYEAFVSSRDRVSRIPLPDTLFSSTIGWVTPRDTPVLPSLDVLADAFAAYARRKAG